MSCHINAKKGDIAKTILLPGDPLRAEYVAKNFLNEAKPYNKVRNMLGFTGTYQGQPVSVQGTGMGIPSISIYTHELINEFGCETLIRIGSCGSFQEDIKVRDVILAQAASTDSSVNKLTFQGMDFAPVSDFELLDKAYHAAQKKNIPVRVGNILASDRFYQEDPEAFKLWANHGVLAVEMETSALYTIAARHKARALTILTVSDSLITGDSLSAEEREKSFNEMVEVALEVSLSQ